MGLSSFGFGGVNGHAVLMSYNNPIDNPRDGGLYLVPLTVRSEAGVATIREFLEKEKTNEATLSFLAKSMLSRDWEQPVKGFAIVQLPVNPLVSANVAIRWTSKTPVSTAPPLWIVIQDVCVCRKLPHKDLLNVETFRNSVEASQKILLDLSCDVPVMDWLQSYDPESLVGTHILVCSTICILAMVDLLVASNIHASGYVGSGLSEIVVAYLDGCLTRRQCLQVALAFEDTLESSREDLKKYAVYNIRLSSELDYKLGPTARVLARVGPSRLIAALPVQEKNNILSRLCAEGGVYRELENKPIIYTKLADETATRLKTKLKEIIPNPKMRSDQYRSCTFTNICDTESLCGPEYFTKLVQTTVNQLQTVSGLPSSAMVVSLCLSDFCNQDESTRPEVHCHGTARSVLDCLGELHMLGHKIDVGHLYTASSGPLDCSIPPLSPLVTWNHGVQYPVPDWCQFTTRVRNTPKEAYKLPDRDLERSMYDPLALLIFHAWSAVCASKSKLEPILLHSFTVTPELMRQERLQGATIQVHQGRQTFTVLSEFGIVMSGGFDLPGQSMEIPLLPGYDVDVNENVEKLQDECEPDVDTHEVLWEDNWLDFINATLEYVNPLTQRLPIRAMIDPAKHLEITRSCSSVLVMKEEATGLCKAGGLLVQFQPTFTPSLEQSMLIQTLGQSESRASCMVDHLLLYSLPRQTVGEDKLLLYLGCDEDKSREDLGMVYIGNGEIKRTSWKVPDDWLLSDMDSVVPLFLAHHTLYDVAEVKPRQSVLVLPPLDTVAIYMMCLLQRDVHDVYTATWDPEISLMVGSAFPNVTVLNPSNLSTMLRQHTKGHGVDICIKSDGSDMDMTLDLIAPGGRCIQIGRPSEKDQVGLAAFLSNLTLVVLNPATVFSQLPDLPDDRVKAILDTLCSSSFRKRTDDGYPEPRGLRYSVEEQITLTRPVDLHKLFTFLDNPGNKARDILDELSSEDGAWLEKLQLALAVRPQEFSLSQYDTSYSNDSREQLNPSFDVSKFCTQLSVPTGCTAPPNTTVRGNTVDVDMTNFTSGSIPFIRVSLTSVSRDCRGAQTRPSGGSLSFPGSKLGNKLEESSSEDNVFVTPQGKRLSSLGVFRSPVCQQTMDLLVVRSPKTPLTPSCRGVKKLLTPSTVTPVLCRLNQVESNDKHLFVVHPVTGILLFLKGFGQKLKVPCYGIQRTPSTPTTSVQAIASFYRNAIEVHDPIGPYRIAGYCYGGMIAFEIAKQLQKANKQVECLVILDGGPSYIHAQIDNGRALLTTYTSDEKCDDAVEVVALMNFLEMYVNVEEPDYVRGVLEILPTQRDRVRMVVDLISGDVVMTRPVKTKWLSVKQKVLNKDGNAERANVHGVASEIIRLSREKKAEEYINSVLIADNYRPKELFQGDIHLIRIKPEETGATVHVMADYGLGQMCTGEVKVTYAPGNHHSFLESDNVVEHVHHILG